MTAPLTPEGVRALIAGLSDLADRLTFAQVKSSEYETRSVTDAARIMLTSAAAALSASLPREDADLDAAERIAGLLEEYEFEDDASEAPATMYALIERVRTAEAGMDRVRALAESALEDQRIMDEGSPTRLIARATLDAEEVVEALASRTVKTAEETGASLIAAERARQVTDEGYDAEHDRGHAGDLAEGASAYVAAVLSAPLWKRFPPPLWPWPVEFWKPTGDPVRDLTKAGALIAAAIDSLLLSPVPPTVEESDRA